MVQIVHDIVKVATLEVVKIMNYISISCDEVTNFDSQSWLSLHIDLIKMDPKFQLWSSLQR
jgi:hypothetical protein